jgi:hypothetical protein
LKTAPSLLLQPLQQLAALVLWFTQTTKLSARSSLQAVQQVSKDAALLGSKALAETRKLVA